MTEISNAMAKLAGVRRAAQSALDENVTRHSSVAVNHESRRAFSPTAVGHYFAQTEAQIDALRTCLPGLFGDFEGLSIKPDVHMPTADSPNRFYYSRPQMELLLRTIDQVFEIRANSQQIVPLSPLSPSKIFLSHGRSKDWYEVQAFIEKDMELKTLELAQEPSKGQTIVEKLEANSAQCDSAVIVMSGDDSDAAGQAKVRENVMHEIGYFQGKYGRRQVILLHEEGVSVPTNLAGIVYVPYPKAMVAAGFTVLARELRAIYQS